MKESRVLRVLERGLICDEYSSEIVLKNGAGRIDAKVTPEGVFCDANQNNIKLLIESGLSFVSGKLEDGLFSRDTNPLFSQLRLNNNYRLKPTISIDSREGMERAVFILAKLVENLPLFKEFDLVAIPRLHPTTGQFIIDIFEPKKGDARLVYLWAPRRGLCNIVCYYDVSKGACCLKIDTACKTLNPNEN